MNACRTCGADTYIDFRTRTLRCSDCRSLAIECTCAPVPEWVRRARGRRLPAKVEVAA